MIIVDSLGGWCDKKIRVLDDHGNVWEGILVDGTVTINTKKNQLVIPFSRIIRIEVNEV